MRLDYRKDERGVTLPLIAVSLFSMLAFAALAIDLASLRDARSESYSRGRQRVPGFSCG